MPELVIMNKIISHSNEHPSSVGMSYWQHFRFAINLSRQTFLASMASLVHAFLPFIFTTTTTRTIFRMYETLKNRLTQNEFAPKDQPFFEGKINN